MSVSSVVAGSGFCQEFVAAGAVSASTGTYPLNEIAPAVASERTPSTNRGVQRPKGVTQSFDHVNVVLRVATPEEAKELVCPGQEWENKGHGGNERDNCWQCGHAKLYEGGKHAPYLSLSSKAMRQLENSGVVTDWRKTFESWKRFYPKYTRIDRAFDEYEGLLDLLEIRRKLDAKELTSRAKVYGEVSGGVMGAGKSRDRTLYIGKRTSETMVRIYDKAAEQKQEGHWNRLELELKGQRADEAVKRYLEEGEGVWAGLLRAHVQFREVTGRARMKNEPVVAWWSAFLSSALIVRLSIHRAVKRLDEVVQWVEKAVAPSLALVLEWSGGDLSVLTGMVSRGLARWGPRHRWIAEEWAR